jgi:hypothetical protein
MGEGPQNVPPPWIAALQHQAAQQQAYPQEWTQGLGAQMMWPQQALEVGQAIVYTTVAAGQYIYPNAFAQAQAWAPQNFTHALSPAEFAEDYYDQCCGTPRSPKERAQELLFEHLTWEEREEWWLTGRITVTAKSGRRYWISAGDCGRYDDGHTFCVYIGMNECPAEDRVLGLKLAIETNEKQFLKTAVDRGASRLPFPQDAQREYNRMVNEHIARIVEAEQANKSRWRRLMERWT